MEQEKPVLVVNRSSFLHWYFDEDIIENFFHHHRVLDQLEEDGVFSITAEALLDGVGYLPDHVVEDGQEIFYDDLEEVDMGAYSKIVFSS
jgi:hypothetical protein